MIYVGIDDTDMPDTRGTNQLARAIVARLCANVSGPKPFGSRKFECVLILRHQLCHDPRIPCTSQNGSATILLSAESTPDWDFLFATTRQTMREWYVEGSDPGLCITEQVPRAITQFGERCQREMVTQAEARQLAAEHELHLEGLGGTEGGVIGALAAVGLAYGGNDGRVVNKGTWPDDLSGPVPVDAVRSRDITVRCVETRETLTTGTIDVGKHLRPSYRAHRVVLFAERHPDPEIADWIGLKLP